MNAMFIDISDLQVRYPGRDKAAVEDVSFGLHKGQMGVLIGPSGCGKTTLLRAVAGLEPLSGGVIRANDTAAEGFQPGDRPQQGGLATSRGANQYAHLALVQAKTYILHRRLVAAGVAHL